MTRSPSIARRALLGLPICGIGPLTLRQYLLLEEIDSPAITTRRGAMSDLEAARAWYVLTSPAHIVTPLLADRDVLDREVVQSAPTAPPMADVRVALEAVIEDAFAAAATFYEPGVWDNDRDSSEKDDPKSDGLGMPLRIASAVGELLTIPPEALLEEPLARLFAFWTAHQIRYGLRWNCPSYEFIDRMEAEDAPATSAAKESDG